jgi:hypothetical protein
MSKTIRREVTKPKVKPIPRKNNRNSQKAEFAQFTRR